MKFLKKPASIMATALIGLFVITRLFIWLNPPPEFTEIIYSYMPYAHLWANGTKPYLEQWYEYPPLTIPLFYIPHLVDMATLSQPLHLPYLTAYKLSLLLVDFALFLLIFKLLRRAKVKLGTQAVALGYYCLVTAKAHHFLYDSMDITFAFGLLLGAAGATPFSRSLGYFAATALKYVNAPLGVVYLLLERKRHLIRNLLIYAFAGLLIWGWALVSFRSSLLVSFVYHGQRGLQVESVPAQVAATINAFTHTETYKEVYKNYDITGPVSVVVKKIWDVLFFAGLALLGIWMCVRAYLAKAAEAPYLRMSFTGLYIFALMFFSKILSTPFLLWHIPLLAAFPFRHSRNRWLAFSLSAIMIIISMTKIPNLPIGIFSLHLMIGWVRSVIIACLFYILWHDRKEKVV